MRLLWKDKTVFLIVVVVFLLFFFGGGCSFGMFFFPGRLDSDGSCYSAQRLFTQSAFESLRSSQGQVADLNGEKKLAQTCHVELIFIECVIIYNLTPYALALKIIRPSLANGLNSRANVSLLGPMEHSDI